MFHFIWGQLRGRAGRSVALLAGVLVATTGFVVLTGATTTSRLEVTGTVERNTRAAYDILVRPKGTRTPLEEQRRLVRPNYLSGLFGGITAAQYERVRAVDGVTVAAPIAMLGYSTTAIELPLDLTDAVDRSLDRQVIRVDRTFLAERGLTRGPAQPLYIYVTKHRLLYPLHDGWSSDAVPYNDGRRYDSQLCGDAPREVLSDGRSGPICDPRWYQGITPDTFSERQTWTAEAFRLLPDGRFETNAPGAAGSPLSLASDRLVVKLALTVPFLLAAVDPDAEQRLVGLSGAVVDGRPLTSADTVQTESRYGSRSHTLPVLVSARPYLDGAIRTTWTRVTPRGSIADVAPDALARTLQGAPAVPAGGTVLDSVDGYRAQLATGQGADKCCWGQLQRVVQPGQTGYDQLPDGTLRARPAAESTVYTDGRMSTLLPRPWLTEDTPFRGLTELRLGTRSKDLRQWRSVGVFDPEKLTGFSDLGKVPLETYEPPLAAGADAHSRGALGGRPLQPSGNPAGYLSAPPLLLTNLASMSKLLEGGGSPQRTAPISAIRVRVADVHGYSERSAERVRLIAERIAQTTGLDVDITLGSSPAPQTVELPAGAFGRPALRLTENWSALGVASTITRAVDRKSAALFLLVLVVCVLFLGNAVSAAVRDRRPELAVLACLGWPARRIGALILGEVAALGLASGLLAVGVAFPLGAALHIDVDWRRALLAVPVALLLAVAGQGRPAQHCDLHVVHRHGAPVGPHDRA
ncbi:FtsX-like permease family protein, partial [Micromonospora sp. NPDC003776]